MKYYHFDDMFQTYVSCETHDEMSSVATHHNITDLINADLPEFVVSVLLQILSQIVGTPVENLCSIFFF